MKDQLKIFGPAILLVIAAFVVAFQFVKPAPPSEITIASGGPTGAYHTFAQAYAEYLAAEGITLNVITTQGSLENIRLLHEGTVDVALVQGGVRDDQGSETLQSLGSLYFEPLWLFHKKDENFDRLGALAGKRVAVGPEGSGTRALVTQLLDLNEFTDDDLDLKPLGGEDAKNALINDEVDAAFFVSSPRSETVQSLLNNPDIVLASFERAGAYARRFKFLSNLVLPEGMVDLKRNIPPRDTVVLAPAANLVATSDLHPALVDLLLMAARTQHADGDWFERRNQFPGDELLAYPLSDEAERFFENGPPLLQKYLPFWAASLIDRLKVMLFPLVLMMLPLIKVMPPVYNWRMRARVYRWYRELDDVDQVLFTKEGLDSGKLKELTGELDRIEADVRDVSVPLSFANQLYHLRQHIDLVRKRLSELSS